jgi:hypothetical protein
MEKKEALKILKEVLDAASKSGLFSNLDSAIVAANAYKTIESFVNDESNGSR